VGQGLPQPGLLDRRAGLGQQLHGVRVGGRRGQPARPDQRAQHAHGGLIRHRRLHLAERCLCLRRAQALASGRCLRGVPSSSRLRASDGCQRSTDSSAKVEGGKVGCACGALQRTRSHRSAGDTGALPHERTGPRTASSKPGEHRPSSASAELTFASSQALSSPVWPSTRAASLRARASL